MRLAFSAQTLVPSRAFCLIFMSVPPAACQVCSVRCLCGDRDGTRQLPSVPWRAGGERTAGRVPSFLRNEAVRQPTIYTGRTGASSGAAKSSFVPPRTVGRFRCVTSQLGQHGGAFPCCLWPHCGS